MLNYIIIAFVILMTVYLLYKIHISFQNINTEMQLNKTSKTKDEVKVNILTDCIVILSQEKCPYCKMLEEQIAKSSKKYTIIKFNSTGNFEFDNTFISLDISERDNIIKEISKLLDNRSVLFPTIIKKNVIYKGLPKPEKLKEIFN